MESRGIGIGNDSLGTPWPIPVGDLGAFSGGSVSGSGLAPREAAYYRVTVPAGTTSWSAKLASSVGESLLLIRQGRLPNIYAANGTESDNASSFNGNLRQKSGAEYFYKYQPSSGATTITPGIYYLAVVSEGQNPASNTTIGTGSVEYTLTSEGTVPINDKTGTPVTAISPVSWSGETQLYGQQKIYRFRLPAGLTSAEVRLKNRVGNPTMSMRQDAAGSGLIPNPAYATYRANEGGRAYTTNNDTLITLTQPAEGDYTVIVSNQSLYVSPTTTYPDAGYDLEIAAQGVVDLVFTNSSLPVNNQEANTWRYFKMVVPTDALGWDFRLKATGGTPRLVVRRDQLPAAFGSTYSINWRSDWPTGYQWEGGDDWTGRYNNPGPVRDRNKYLVMGMGSPLEPGTYFVGVSGADTMSYTLESRGIGIGNDSLGTPWPIPVGDLGAFSGGSVSGSGLAPREAAYYRVTVPAGTTSWSAKLASSVGESLLLIRQGRLPNIYAANGTESDNASSFNGNLRQKSGAEYFYKYQPSSGATTITPGIYYLAVVSEGQNPASNTTIGTGSVEYTLTSEGTVPINDKTGTPVTAISPVSWSGETQLYGQQKIYRFRLPAGLTSAEVRLKNRIGNPTMSMRQDAAGSGLIPNPAYATYRANEGGRAYTTYNDTLITVPQPVEGDYTVIVSNQSLYVFPTTTYPDAGYDLEVRALTPAPLPITGGAVGGSLVDQQVAYYQVEVPAAVNGQPVLGWLLKSAVSSGAVNIRARKDLVPGSTTAGVVASANSAITIVPPVLTPGTWYVEVKGTGITDYTLSSDIVSADPAKHRRTWAMPSRIGTFTQPGLTAPWFGDSGIDDSGAPIINPDTFDQGTDLARGEWHFYRVSVPVGNSALLRTVVEALSGTPQVYLRTGNVPSIDHSTNTTTPTSFYLNYAYDRSQTLTGTLYGNWVPLDGKVETALPAGDWWIGVRAVTTNIRYRLRLAAGDVHDAGGTRLDTAGYVQDLAQSGGSVTGQNLAAKDMRYYRVTVPQSSTTLAGSTPLSWNLTLAQQVGDVVVFIRDTIPPGQGSDGNAGSTVSYSAAQSSYFQDWFDDNSPLSPVPYTVIDAPGTTSLSLPPVEPGKTYYLGVYARTDATFDLSSSVGGSNLALTAVLPFAGGTDSRTLAVNETALYRIDVPSNAILWHHSSTNVAGVQSYLMQGTVPPENTYAHWRSSSSVNTVLNQALGVFPWQGGHSYYLLVRNTTATAQPFSITMDGRSELVTLNITVAGNGSGSIGSSPSLISCASGTCSAQIFPYTSITLTRNWATGTTFTGWSGDCSGTGNCTLIMNVPHTATATFTLNSYTVTTSRTGNIGGSITSSPAGIDCRAGGTCSTLFLYGTGITLTATPDAGYVFTGWSNACTGTGACAFTVDNNKTATATFAPLRTLTVGFNGSGSGTVTSTSDAGISCTTGSTVGCTYDYLNGTVVTLIAVPDWKSVFSNWTGVTFSSGSNGSITMSTTAKTVTATFGSAANARIGAQDYATLLAAYTAAPTGATILMKDLVFQEDSFFEPTDVAAIYTLKGGFTDFAGSAAAGYSTIKGDLKVLKGRLNVQRLIVRQP
ncbi:MAG: InlB B-repeat-containing protein [Geobacteraceae bacterium]|nr:InlB B-repeat-containing protein [Geobacteraceae bacterium]